MTQPVVVTAGLLTPINLASNTKLNQLGIIMSRPHRQHHSRLAVDCSSMLGSADERGLQLVDVSLGAC